jgi:neutral ceramidase
MTRAEARLARAVAGLAALIALFGPWPIPRGAFEETAAGRAAVALAGEAGRAAVREAGAGGGRLEAGFGRVPIDVPAGANLAGYGTRARRVPSAGTHDRCAARGIALREGPGGAPALVLGADILYVNDVVRRRVLDALARDPGLAAERVFFTATHTHSGPGNWARSFAESIAAGAFREDVTGAVVRALVLAGREAVRDLAPAEARVVRASGAGLVRNRYFEDGRAVPVDAEIGAVVFERRGALAGLFVSLGAHATLVGAERPLVSADWPGGLARCFEEDRGARACLFAAGPVGSQGPEERAIAGLPGDAFARAEAFGRLVAAPALARGGAPARGVGLRTIEVALPPLAVRIAPDLRVSALLAATQLDAGPAPLSVLRLGDELFLGFPCEVSGEVALAMKAAARARGVSLTVLSFSGAYHGYVPPDAYWEEWRYENRLSLHGPRFAAYLEALAEGAASGGRPGAR